MAGRNLPTIFGHRDVMATSCPGNAGYATLPRIRSNVATALANRASAPAPTRQPATPYRSVQRLAAADRYGTSVQVSRELAPRGSSTVYVASGVTFADALTAGAATQGKSPLLLTRPTSVPAGVMNELKRLKPRTVNVVGGPGSVSNTVVRRIERETGATVKRISGKDRYATAVAVAKRANVQYLASGQNFPDALSAVPLAGKQNSSILLTHPHNLTGTTRAFLRHNKPSKVVIVGGPASVNSRVVYQLRDMGITVERVSGATRYDVALSMAKRTNSAPRNVVVASGATFSDAVAAGPLAISRNAPVVLTTRNRLHVGSRAYATQSSVRQVYIVGGPGAVSDGVVRSLR